MAGWGDPWRWLPPFFFKPAALTEHLGDFSGTFLEVPKQSRGLGDRGWAWGPQTQAGQRQWVGLGRRWRKSRAGTPASCPQRIGRPLRGQLPAICRLLRFASSRPPPSPCPGPASGGQRGPAGARRRSAPPSCPELARGWGVCQDPEAPGAPGSRCGPRPAWGGRWLSGPGPRGRGGAGGSARPGDSGRSCSGVT